MAYGESDNYNANITGPQPSHIVKAGTAVLNATTTAAVENPGRSSITISNMATEILYIALGDTAESNKLASATKFHFALKACAAVKDGTGGTVQIDDYTGSISAHSATKSYTVVEFLN